MFDIARLATPALPRFPPPSCPHSANTLNSLLPPTPTITLAATLISTHLHPTSHPIPPHPTYHCYHHSPHLPLLSPLTPPHPTYHCYHHSPHPTPPTTVITTHPTPPRSTEAGYPFEALVNLTGAPYARYNLDEDTDDDIIWAKIRANDDKGYLQTGSTAGVDTLTLGGDRDAGEGRFVTVCCTVRVPICVVHYVLFCELCFL